MITRIEAYHYRCFQGLNVALDKFQVFVGPNGAGKTTLLDVPVVLGEMLTMRSISKAFFEPTESHVRPRADAPSDLIFNGAGTFFILAVEAKLTEAITSQLMEKQSKRLKPKSAELLRTSPTRWLTHIRYEIEFEIFNDVLQIAQEYLILLPEGTASDQQRGTSGMIGEWLQEHPRSRLVMVIERPRGGKVVFTPEAEKRGPRNPYGFPPDEPAFANVFADADRYGAALWLRGLLTSETCAYQPSLTAMRTAQPRRPTPQVSRDASSLAWLAQTLAAGTPSLEETEVENDASEPSTFQRWERFARLALPALARIEPFVRPDDQHAYLRLHYTGGAGVPAAGVSDGTLLILALTILPFLSQTPALITQEEPENGVHPKGIELIVEALQSVSASQVFLSTHSPLVLTQCQPAQRLPRLWPESIPRRVVHRFLRR